jgi:DNA-binding transcriptional regulator GbsR (MarR family)
LNYEESVQIIYLAQKRFEPQKIENWNLVQKVFNQSYFYSTGDTTEFNFRLNEEKVTRYMNNNYALLTYDQSLIQQIRNWAYSSSTNYKVELKLLNDTKTKSISAMDALKKEYHLNN